MTVELIAELKGHNAPIYKIKAFEGVLYSASSDKMLGAWDLNTNNPSPFSIKAESALYTFLVNKRRIYLGTSSGNLHVIDRQEKSEVKNLKLHKKGLYTMNLSNKLDLLVTGGGDGFVQFLKESSLELLRTIKLSDFKIRKILFNEEKKTVLLVGGDGFIRELETEYFNEIASLNVSSDSVNAMETHPKKPVYVVAGKDGFMRALEENLTHEVMSIPAHNMAVYDLAFSPSSDVLCSVSRDKSIKLWSVDSLEPLLKIDRKSKGHTHSVNTICWIGDDEFCTAGDDRIIRRWKIQK